VDAIWRVTGGFGETLIRVDTIIVGAGVVGLALARDVAASGRSVILVERHEGFGRELSSRNSEVIHAGIYYAPGSLKAALSVRGRELLYAYMTERHVPYRKTGKLIVATENQQKPRLAELMSRAHANGVEDVTLVSSRQASALEPALRCVQALESPSTGIFDTHVFMARLAQDAKRLGAVLSFRTPFERAEKVKDGFDCWTGGSEPARMFARVLINAAGLSAPSVARTVDAMPAEHVPRMWLAKGSYVRVRAKIPFQRLIYPLPETGGLGIHLSWDLSGQGRAGPDLEWVDTLDFSVDASRIPSFRQAILRYWPSLPEDALVPDFASVRPKLHGPTQAPTDFLIQGQESHGVEGLIHLFGLESPGLTASLALAEHIGQTL
jgi:L-2-hydroxyglutarate oxidase LhgO